MRRRVPDSEHHHEALLRPPEKTFKRKLKDLIWDSENKTCLTRSPINWLTITVYYLIFVSCVILLLYISLQIVYSMSSKHKNRPQYILDDSPIGTSPSLNYFPLSNSKPLIWLSSNRDYTPYVEEIEKVFRAYKKANESFTTDKFAECGRAPFGYDQKTPCIFFRLNRLILWKPTPYKKGDSLPDNLPDKVKDLIKDSDSPKVWLTCNGTTAKDRDHITQDFFQLQGTKGFDISAFPFDGQKDFIDPIVALKLNDVKKEKTLYSFTCTAWSNKLNVNKTAVDVVYFFE